MSAPPDKMSAPQKYPYYFISLHNKSIFFIIECVTRYARAREVKKPKIPSFFDGSKSDRGKGYFPFCATI